MDTMQFAKYSCDIREILSKVDQEGLENLVRNAVAYAQSNNNGKANWIAQELFADVSVLNGKDVRLYERCT